RLARSCTVRPTDIRRVFESARFAELSCLFSGAASALRREILLDGGRTLATLVDGPDHERCSAPRVAAGKDAWPRGGVVIRSDVAALVLLHGRLRQAGVALGSGEAYGHQHQLGRQEALRARFRRALAGRSAGDAHAFDRAS